MPRELFKDEPGPLTKEAPRKIKMIALIDRLLRDAPKMEGAAPDDAGALECQIMLKNGYRAVGALAMTPDGLLRFMVIGQEQGGNNRVVAVEHFFDYEDLECLAVPRGAVEHPAISRIVPGRG